MNVTSKIYKMDQNLVKWMGRGLKISGKIVIIYTFGISQLIYSMQISDFRDDNLSRIEVMIFKFLCKNWYGHEASDRIARSTLK
jgi:hypothetical protein